MLEYWSVNFNPYKKSSDALDNSKSDNLMLKHPEIKIQ